MSRSSYPVSSRRRAGVTSKVSHILARRQVLEVLDSTACAQGIPYPTGVSRIVTSRKKLYRLGVQALYRECGSCLIKVATRTRQAKGRAGHRVREHAYYPYPGAHRLSRHLALAGVASVREWVERAWLPQQVSEDPFLLPEESEGRTERKRVA